MFVKSKFSTATFATQVRYYIFRVFLKFGGYRGMMVKKTWTFGEKWTFIFEKKKYPFPLSWSMMVKKAENLQKTSGYTV